MDTEINFRIGKASGIFARLSERVWDNPKLTIRKKSAVYRACVCSTLLYGSEKWTLSTMQKRKLTPFTNDASAIFLELDGNIRLLTKKC